MTAKQWLNRARRIDEEIDRLLLLKKKTYDRLVSITAQIDSTSVSGTKDQHKFDRLAEISGEIDKRVDELHEVKSEIFRTINKLDDRTERLVLIGRYLDNMSFEEIAVGIHYSYKQTCRIHGKALLSVTDVLECPIDK